MSYVQLLLHSYIAMTTCAEESNFTTYYQPDLKAFCKRVLAEELERHPFKTGQYASQRLDTSIQVNE